MSAFNLWYGTFRGLDPPDETVFDKVDDPNYETLYNAPKFEKGIIFKKEEIYYLAKDYEPFKVTGVESGYSFGRAGWYNGFKLPIEYTEKYALVFQVKDVAELKDHLGYEKDVVELIKCDDLYATSTKHGYFEYVRIDDKNVYIDDSFRLFVIDGSEITTLSYTPPLKRDVLPSPTLVWDFLESEGDQWSERLTSAAVAEVVRSSDDVTVIPTAEPFCIPDKNEPLDQEHVISLVLVVVSLYAGNCQSEPAKAAQTLGIQNIPVDIAGFRMREFYFKNIVTFLYAYVLGFRHLATVANMLVLMGLGELVDKIAPLPKTLTKKRLPRIPDPIFFFIVSGITEIYIIARGWKVRGLSEAIRATPQDAVQDITGRGFNFVTVLCALGVIRNTGSTRSLVRAALLGSTMYAVPLLQICCECVDQCSDVLLWRC